MADNIDDEYEFADMDALTPDPMGEEISSSGTKYSSDIPAEGKNNILRNALIAIVVIIAAMLIYKFTGSFFSKNAPVDSSVPEITPAIVTPVTPVVEQPITPVQPVSEQNSPDYTELTQKVSTLDLGQQNLRSEVNSLNNQLSGINQNINNLNAKIASLSQMVSTLSTTVEQQSTQISQLLIVRTQPPKVHVAVKRVQVPQVVYYIQAVIPGRAWLIATNGSTLTVREGTKIAGYGTVKLIDPNQGRVLMSSGRVIRFSQQDS